MHLKKLQWRNIKSFGNTIQEIEFPDEGALWMVTGLNGAGKCLSKDTKITIIINNKIIEKQFLKFINKK